MLEIILFDSNLPAIQLRKGWITFGNDDCAVKRNGLGFPVSEPLGIACVITICTKLNELNEMPCINSFYPCVPGSALKSVFEADEEIFKMCFQVDMENSKNRLRSPIEISSSHSSAHIVIRLELLKGFIVSSR